RLGEPAAVAVGAAGLALLGGLAAELHRRWGLRSPAVVVVVAVLAAMAVEIAVPGPRVVALDGDRLTLGQPVLARFAAGWPLLLALALLAALAERRWRRPVRPSWGTALRIAAAAAGVFAALVLLAGVLRGWLAAPPPYLAVTAPVLAGSAFLAALPLVRARALAPAVVLGAALGVAVVACWVQRVGDPVAGLLSFIGIYCAMALLVSAVELAARAGLARIRRGRGAGVARGRRAATVGAVGRPARAPGTPDP
ncbi:MAG TPA: hypothetical protein VEZ42_01490, partial [Pseudonocardia sp.]|nr:hypothetical protein [Pseudonocardia sp.]